LNVLCVNGLRFSNNIKLPKKWWYQDRGMFLIQKSEGWQSSAGVLTLALKDPGCVVLRFKMASFLPGGAEGGTMIRG
jgi:hypothetical protein